MTAGAAKVLLVEDDESFARLVIALLSSSPDDEFDIEWVRTLTDGCRRLHDGDVAACLLDLGLPESNGIETFLIANAASKDVPIVVLSGIDDEAVALKVVDAGAQDYLVKSDVERERIGRVLRYAIERQHNQTERRRRQDEVFAAISHEFRTPLTALRMEADIALRLPLGELGGGGVNLAHAVRESVSEMLQLVEQILDITKYALTEPEMNFEQVDVRQLVREVRPVLEPLARDAELRISFLVGENVPPVKADPLRFRQVLMNLLANGIKYTPPGGWVRLSISRAGDSVRFEVTDTGIGIPEDSLERLFEPFYKAPGSQTQKGQLSTGLGLAVTKRNIDAHGATIEVTSKVGRGTTFVVTMPVA